ncbi:MULTISPECIES: HEPN domain-containing protein [Paenibacillus]|uniref:HEPN domain-containing protein n=1 Tax=Paenibacillus apis TaxID=1792174 RepID=A0A919Y3P6_9BACL|nr:MULTISPECIES: HEPN domain-containing protein [Paenibacillus]GIO41572.1 hypothetical protein J41TS4_13300 [Paenibacillus apis]
MKQNDKVIELTANAYFESYKCLMDSHISVWDKNRESYSVFFVPAITTAAFSCELAIKSMIQKESETIPKTHDLNKLFYQLNKNTRKEIIKNYYCL